MKARLLRNIVVSATILTHCALSQEEPPAYFGSATEFTGLTGNLYDLKVGSDGDFTDVAPNGSVKYEECYEAIEDLARKGFRQKDLDEYSIGDTTCDFKALAIKYTEASIAPVAFGSPEIKPTGIIIVYKGVVEEAPEEEIRFAGWFDDAMLVLVNDEVVFYTAWREDKTRYKSKEFGNQRAAKIKETGGLTGIGDAYGEYIQLKKGDTLQIVVAEIPGGNIGGTLKVQVKDKHYKDDKHDDPILHPFVAGELSRDDEKVLEESGIEFDLRQIPEFKFSTGAPAPEEE
ncbi:MAG: hypothetical protein NWT08_08510 [Akkermansiaceae bacterium]|jgi:hypothetical protein|nr:hypothetical protein [Akkermansiaceae bacterium]MDP4647986.1 hypothetical protein [Akkermansiaceae bacterium]MDP4719777.1 hypothetical protein [Akkermansiaceae bacterium]MDP4781333.1 hypothetical protein [Akkermansiaceae bacterium]MDP4846088.1 hypothetical protein [Akkermansiaceae bacterium]